MKYLYLILLVSLTGSSVYGIVDLGCTMDA